jgi:hypothetical protein
MGNLQRMVEEIWSAYFLEIVCGILIDRDILGDVIYFEALGNKFLILNSLDAINTLLVERSANYSDRIKSPIIHL